MDFYRRSKSFSTSTMNENKVLEHLLRLIEEYRSGERNEDFLHYHSPSELAQLLQLDKPIEQGDWQEIFQWVEKYLQYSVKTNHPDFVNRMWVGANLPSVVGEIVTAVTNTSACTFESAPVSTLVEKYMIQQMLDVVGFSRGEGQMTTGSSNANMIAMMAARNLANEEVKRAGLFGQQKLFGFVGADSHYSMDKAANILGLGTDQLVKVPVNKLGEMEGDALQDALERVQLSGGRPFFVAVTAGTTVRGAYDPIEPVLLLRQKYDFWLHVDGAWGGAAVFSPTLRKRYLRGLPEADSFTCDFHKMLGAALMCNILLINNRTQALRTVLSAGDGSYLFRDEGDNEIEDLGAVSLQCGRRVDSLKWFLDWKYFGREGFAQRVENSLQLCCYAESVVENSAELEMVVPRSSFNVCFCYRVAEKQSNRFNLELRTRLYHQGITLVGVAYISGKLVMRLLLTNPLGQRDTVDRFFSYVIREGNKLLKEKSLIPPEVNS